MNFTLVVILTKTHDIICRLLVDFRAAKIGITHHLVAVLLTKAIDENVCETVATLLFTLVTEIFTAL